jgi:hypothetical protein
MQIELFTSYKQDLTKREKKFRKTSEKMEGFSSVKPVTGLSRPNTGKEDDDKQDLHQSLGTTKMLDPRAGPSVMLGTACGQNLFYIRFKPSCA